MFDIFDHACCAYFASSNTMMVSVITVTAVADYGGSADFANCAGSTGSICSADSAGSVIFADAVGSAGSSV